jgi:hypothetical protein
LKRGLTAGSGQRHDRCVLAEADQVAVGARPRAEPLSADVERLEQIRLAGAVLADDQDDARTKLEIEPSVRAVLAKRDGVDDQRTISRRGGSA